MKNVIVMFKIAVGFDPERGYAAWICDGIDHKEKGIKGNSIRQLMRRVSEAVCEEEQKKRRFPLEHERTQAQQRLLVSPDYQ